jgi:hypothetical protein
VSVGDCVFLATQANESTDLPLPSDCFAIGTVGVVRNLFAVGLADIEYSENGEHLCRLSGWTTVPPGGYAAPPAASD